MAEEKFLKFLQFLEERQERQFQQQCEMFEKQTALMERILSCNTTIRKQDCEFSSEKVHNVPPFQAFSIGENEEWEPYLCRLNQHFEAHKVSIDEQKRAYFLSWAGTDIFNLLRKLYGNDDVSKQFYSNITQKLTEYFKSTTHILAARYKFNKTLMQPYQTYTSWVAELRGIARDCNFKCTRDDCNHPSVDEHIRDMIILHTPHDHVRTVALQNVNPSLEEVLKIAEIYETTQLAKKSLNNDDPTNLPVVHQMSSKYRKRGTSLKRSYKGESEQLLFCKSCPYCISQHQRKDCRYLKATCKKCGKTGHIATVCCSSIKNNKAFIGKSKSNTRNPNNSTTYQLSEDCVQSLDFEESKLQYFVNVEINGHKLRMLMDSGATCSMIGLEGYKALGAPPLKPASAQLKAYGNFRVPLKGWMLVTAKLGSKIRTLRLLVTNSPSGVNIFGTSWFQVFGFKIQENVLNAELVNAMEVEERSLEPENQSKIEEICKSHSVVFEEVLGTCTTFKAKLFLKQNAKPKFFKPRPIPFSKTDAVKQELLRLEMAGIIKSVKTSEWAAPIVIVDKPNGSVRICGDFKVTINPQLEIEQYPLPRAEELFQKLKYGKHFTKIDLADAYLQIKLDDEAKQIVVINTPFGLYQYQRLAFGIASAPAIYQRFLEQVISGLNGCANFLDDIIVSGSTMEEHLTTLEKLFQRLEEHGLRCNFKKCEFLKDRVEYLGNVLSADGIAPSETNLNAVKKLPPPQNLAQLQSFIGKVNYYNKFIPNFSEISAPLNILRKKKQKISMDKGRK